jgi:predicted TIM-barrel fold metal-dependent hydrolase
MLEYPFETTRMVASLLRGGVIKDLPDIRFITTHGGGAVPFLGPHRMSIIIPMQLAMEAKKAGRTPSLTPKDVAAQLKTLFFDVAAATIPPYLLGLQELAPTSQILTGFDFPFMPVQSIPRAIHALESYDEYSKADREDVFSKNALTLYPRLASKE